MNDTPDTGAEEYRRWVQGDEDAFGRIIALYRKNLIFFINRYLNNPTLSEEVAADTFAELVIHKRAYNCKVSLKTYLYSIAKNKACNLLRESRHYTGESVPEDVRDCADIERELIADERKAALYRAIKALPEDMAQAVYLYWLEDMSYAECARVLKCPEKRVDNLLYRAKILLRETLTKEGWE